MAALKTNLNLPCFLMLCCILGQYLIGGSIFQTFIAMTLANFEVGTNILPMLGCTIGIVSQSRQDIKHSWYV